MIKLFKGDCLELMKDIPDKSIDLILCDLPYGTTACSWDSVIPFEPLWKEYIRISSGAVVLFSSQPFTTDVINSNRKYFKYSWTWIKNISTNFLHAHRMPLRKSEDICVFYKTQPIYNPQKTTNHPPTQSSIGSSDGVLYHGKNIRNSAGGNTDRFPTNILDSFKAVDPKQRLHPTQKPIELMEYLIKTYTNEGDTVLDNCMGSGTTGIAAKNLNRNFIGMELDEKYFEIAKKRIEGDKNFLDFAL